MDLDLSNLYFELELGFDSDYQDQSFEVENHSDFSEDSFSSLDDESLDNVEVENHGDFSEEDSLSSLDPLLHTMIEQARAIREDNRLKALWQVESLLVTQLSMFTTHGNASFTFPAIGNWENIELDPEQGLAPVRNEDLRLTFVTFGDARSKSKYVRILLVLNKIHQLLVDDERITKRELYYQLISQDGGNQGQIDDALNAITACLQLPRSHLRILSTSKGLIGGNLVYVDIYGNEVDCSLAKQGQSIPNDIDDIIAIKTEAKLVIVVEKDATFQRLMDENFLDLVNEEVIVITGKGIPDIGTRKMLRKLAFDFLPNASFWALTDSDPYGVEIMSVYMFGSATMAWTGEPLSVPMLEWIGVRPKEMPDLNPDTVKPLTERDSAKLASLLDRNYYSQDIIEELEMMAFLKVKAEIEDIDSPSRYLYEKINQI